MTTYLYMGYSEYDCSFCKMRGRSRRAEYKAISRGKTWRICRHHYQAATQPKAVLKPDHPRQCDNCHGFLKRYDWDCELIPEDKAVVWYTYCGKCGSMNTDG